jgi:hypothetical protein
VTGRLGHGGAAVEMTKLAEMWYLNLSSNNLSGEVTPLLGKIRSLTMLDLSGNPSLCGNDIAGLNSCSSNTTTGDGNSGKTRLVLTVTLSVAAALLVSMVAVVCTMSRKARRAADVVVEKAETSASGESSTAAAAAANFVILPPPPRRGRPCRRPAMAEPSRLGPAVVAPLICCKEKKRGKKDIERKNNVQGHFGTYITLSLSILTGNNKIIGEVSSS